MPVNYENTYWSLKGKHAKINDQLTELIPASGEVNNPDDNPALETYRIATNCYYDLYNNGLCNRGKEFHGIFDFDAFDVGEPRWISRLEEAEDGQDSYSGSLDLTQNLIDRTETRMDEIILAAYAEQFPQTPEQEGPVGVGGDYRKNVGGTG